MSDVLALSFRHSRETSCVLINDVKGVRNFVGPETEIRDMTRELIRIQRDKAAELRRQFFRDGNRVGRDGRTPYDGVSARRLCSEAVTLANNHHMGQMSVTSIIRGVVVVDLDGEA